MRSCKIAVGMPRVYERSPLVEALCEFHFEATQPWDLAIPGLLYAGIRKEFPKRQQGQDSIEVEVNPATNAVVQRPTATRARFSTEDEKAFVQVGPNLLIVNQLRPYRGWDVFSEIVARILGVYNDVAPPAKIARIGLRYINRIEVPQRTVQITDYLLTYPAVPMAESRAVSAWSQRVEIPYQEAGGMLVLQSGSVPGEQERTGEYDFLLDLSFFSVLSQSRELASVLEWLTQGHNIVESMFENCITDKARALFSEGSTV